MNERYTVGIYNGQRAEMEHEWKVCRVLRGGTRALREAGTAFTPMTARERKEPERYRERLDQSTLYDVYNETVMRVASLPFERPPVVVGTLDPRLERILTDADRCGTSLSVFMAQVYQDAIDRGVGLFLVDNVPTTWLEPERGAGGQPIIGDDGMPVMRANIMSLAEAEELDARPYFSRIDPDNLVGWRTETIAGREVCTELRVREWAYVPSSESAVGDDLVERIRVYDREYVTLWQRKFGRTEQSVETRERNAGNSDMTGFALIEQPRPHGFPDGIVPIVPVYTRKVGFLHARPPFLGLAYLNLKHWNQQSVLDVTLRHNLGAVLFGSGMPKEATETPPKVGEGASLMTDSQTASLQYVEISGASLTVAQAEIAKTEARMQAKAVEPLMSGQATATGEMRAEMRDQSEAQRWIEACEWAIYRAFVLAHKWLGLPVGPEFNVTLHRASSLLQIANPARTQSLQTDAREGRLSLLTYLKERARSGDFADDFDPEAEAEAVEQEAERKVMRQMEALANQMIGQREGPPDDGEDGPVPPGQPQDDEQPAEDEAAA